MRGNPFPIHARKTDQVTADRVALLASVQTNTTNGLEVLGARFWLNLHKTVEQVVKCVWNSFGGSILARVRILTSILI